MRESGELTLQLSWPKAFVQFQKAHTFPVTKGCSTGSQRVQVMVLEQDSANCHGQRHGGVLNMNNTKLNSICALLWHLLLWCSV